MGGRYRRGTLRSPLACFLQGHFPHRLLLYRAFMMASPAAPPRPAVVVRCLGLPAYFPRNASSVCFCVAVGHGTGRCWGASSVRQAGTAGSRQQPRCAWFCRGTALCPRPQSQLQYGIMPPAASRAAAPACTGSSADGCPGPKQPASRCPALACMYYNGTSICKTRPPPPSACSAIVL